MRRLRILVTLDVMLAKRRLKAKELAERIGITEANLSLLRTGKVKGVRFETLAKLCEALQCTPGDLLDVEEVAGAPTSGEESDETGV